MSPHSHYSAVYWLVSHDGDGYSVLLTEMVAQGIIQGFISYLCLKKKQTRFNG